MRNEVFLDDQASLVISPETTYQHFLHHDVFHRFFFLSLIHSRLCL